MNPTTSLSMIYLREFERTNSTVRGQVRLARKAGHLLRMHWAYVRLTCQSDRDAVPGVLTLGTDSGRATALPRASTGHPCLAQPSPTAQGAPRWPASPVGQSPGTNLWVADRLYHGGVPGLRVGDILTGGHDRRVHEGCAWCEARANGTAVHDPASHHPDRVYVSSDREYSRFYASLWGYGDLYRVEPIGDLTPSDEDGFPSWTATSVRVAGIVARAVLLTDGQRRRLMRRWKALDYRGTGLAALGGAQ